MARVKKSFRVEVGTWRQIATVAGLVGEDPQQFCERAVIERAQFVYQELLRTQEQKRQAAEESTEGDPPEEVPECDRYPTN